MVLAFGDHRLDIERRELRRGSELVNLEPKAFDLLAFLVLHRDRVISKDELLREVWDGRIVSDSALATRINAVRRALGDDGFKQRLVRTLPRKGVRFVCEVRETPEAAGPNFHRALVPADKPSIAVLPFQNMSGDPEREYFADGTVEEIITALARIRWLRVIARNSSFAYKGRSVDVKQIGCELGVHYLLEGSVRTEIGRVRISAQLIDAITGAHLWGDHFDGSLDGIFDLQDEVAFSVAGAIEPALQVAEVCRYAARPTTDLTTYDLYLRALALFFPVEKAGVIEALRLLEQAISIDPHYGPALALAAVCHLRLADDGWAQDPDTSRCKAKDFARRALQVAHNDPRVVVNAVFVLGRYGEDPGSMIALVDRALALNPSHARGWFVSGLLRTWIGQYDRGIEHLERSMHLSPLEPTGTPLQVIGGAYFFKREFEMAVSKLRLAIQDNPGVTPAYRILASCYAHMGRLDDARRVIAELRTVTDRILLDENDVLPWRKAGDAEFFLSGLRLAAHDAV